MPITWILVANACRAQLLANEGPKKGLKPLRAFQHPESRERASYLVTDRPGQFKSPGNRQGAFAGIDPRENESRRFAQELAQTLEAGRVQNRYQRLIVAASPAFLGQLSDCFSPHVAHLVSERIKKDYTQADTATLRERLEEYIYL